MSNTWLYRAAAGRCGFAIVPFTSRDGLTERVRVNHTNVWVHLERVAKKREVRRFFKALGRPVQTHDDSTGRRYGEDDVVFVYGQIYDKGGAR